MIVSEGLPAQTACRVLGVSESGFYQWRRRPPSARSIRHVWLTDMIRQVHMASRGTYGANRVHAELRMGYGITVGHNAVAMLMQRADLAGLPGNRRRRRLAVPGETAADLVSGPLRDHHRFPDLTLAGRSPFLGRPADRPMGP